MTVSSAKRLADIRAQKSGKQQKLKNEKPTEADKKKTVAKK